MSRASKQNNWKLIVVESEFSNLVYCIPLSLPNPEAICFKPFPVIWDWRDEPFWGIGGIDMRAGVDRLLGYRGRRGYVGCTMYTELQVCCHDKFSNPSPIFNI